MRVPTDVHISPTVQGVLAARIDRLAPDEKALLQQLAVIGREFPLSLVRPVVAQPEDEFYRLLASLQRKEFLYEQPAFPEVEYLFKHALTQEVAYNSVLQERRKALHEQTAQAIEEVYRDRLDDHYSELAHHYSRSGNTQKAIDYLQLAGEQAVQRSAHEEAISHLTTALRAAQDAARHPRACPTRTHAATCSGRSADGHQRLCGPGSRQAYARALALCRQVGETPQLFPVLAGLRVFYTVRGELQTARELGEQLLRLAQSVQDPALLVDAHVALGSPLYFLGELASAREHLEQAIALYDPQQQRASCIAMVRILVSSLSPIWLMSCGCWDIRIRPGSGVAQR